MARDVIRGSGDKQIAEVLDSVRDPRFGCHMKNELAYMVRNWVGKWIPVYLTILAEEAAQEVNTIHEIVEAMNAMERFVMDREQGFADLVDSKEACLGYVARVLMSKASKTPYSQK